MGAPAKQKVVIQATDPVISPWAFRETKLRGNMVSLIKDFQPPGNCDGAQLENIRRFVLAEIEAMPPTANALELIIETQIGPGARQANIILFPKTL